VSPLHVPSFGGGVVLMGAADTRGADEVLQADALDIGPRGALVCASDVSDYVRLVDDAGAAPSALFGLATTTAGPNVVTVAVSQGGSGGHSAYLVHTFPRDGAATPVAPLFAVPDAPAGIGLGSLATPTDSGVYVTTAVVPGTFPGIAGPLVGDSRATAFLVNLGAREGTNPRLAPGLYVLSTTASAPDIWRLVPIRRFDALGTGPYGVLLAEAPHLNGTRSRQLYFRGVTAYNGYVFGWGFDDADGVAGDGPCRVMFSAAGNPLVWGNDNTPDAFAQNGRDRRDPPIDRAFTDSDAIVMGGAGERIRAALPLYGKLFFGTNRGLHFLQGYGRTTFVTNGAQPVMQAYNVVGPYALLEGPDRLLYGVGDQGLWRYDGAGLPEPLFRRVQDYGGRSPGWFDCIWTDPTRAPGFPGKTNADLVWLAVDWDRQQVLVGIPFCNAALGYGPGGDTVVLRYHVATGGFTRQVFAGTAYTSPGYFRADAGARPTRFLGTATGVGATVQRYAAGLPAASPRLPATLPAATFGPYAPFGPDGQGVVPRWMLTLAWESDAALPLAFRVAATVDDAPLPAYTLTIGPTAPVAADGDVWLDTSGSDYSVGNARGSANVAASGGALLKTWGAAARAWRVLAGQGGAGTRATLPLPLARRTGARVTLALTCTAARGRFQLEGIAPVPGAGSPEA
jgi:hypothetical protein